MPLPEQLSSCLFSLTSHCEGLLAQIESLRSENQVLQNRLEVMRLQADQAQEAALVRSVTVPPGLVPDDDREWSSIMPQERPPKQQQKSRTVTVDASPQVMEVQQKQQNQMRRLRLGSKQSSASVATICVEEDDDDEAARAKGNRVVNFKSDPRKPEDGSLAAARLGMLIAHDPTEEIHSSIVSNTLSMFNHVMNDIEHFKTEGRRGCLQLFEAMVDSMLFKALCILAIAANTIYIAFEADYKVKNSYRRIQGLAKQPDLTKPDIVFTVWFGIELLLRMAAQRKLFFLGVDWRWNVFDCFLVANSLVEVAFPFSSQNFSFLRILRVFRLVRIVRVVRTVQALKSLRTMVFSLLNSFVCLMWAFVMIILIMFVFSIVFSNGVAGYFDNLDLTNATELSNAEEMRRNFGNLYETMVSLLCSITGGNDWMTYGSQLRLLDLGEVYFAVFYFYIIFCLVGMLNVVTGIFVDSAVCTRTEDEVVECFTEDQKRTSEEVRRIFKDADTDGSGTLSYEELAAQLENPWVKAYFSGLDIDPSEAGIIFALIDTDGDNSISIDEFVDGTMKLKGHAKSIDVLSMMFDHVRFSHKFNQLCSFIEEEIDSLREAIAPRRDNSPRRSPILPLQCPVPLAALNKISKIR